MSQEKDSSSPSNIMQQANQMRTQMKDLEKQLAQQILTTKHAGIQIMMNGEGAIKNITFDPEIQSDTLVESQCDLLTALNQAQKAVDNNRENCIMSILSNIHTQ